MLKDKLFVSLFILISLIASLHILALELYLYWLLWWFDILVHFLAGLWVGLMSLWIYYRSGFFIEPTHSISRAFLVAAFSIAVISILWEFYEIIIGVPFEENYVQDTILDLVMDALGASIGFAYYASVHLKKEIINTQSNA